MFRWRSPREFCLILVFAFLATPCFAQLDVQSWLDSSTWTDLTGKYRIEATFVRIEQQDVVLKKSDGKEVKVPLNKLNEESRKRAVDAAKKTPGATAPAGKSNAPSSLATGSSPTGSSSNSSSSSKAPIAIPGNLDAKQFVDFLMNHAKDGKWIIFWDAMPAKYQQDIERVAKLAGEKIDPSVMKPINQLQNDIVTVFRTKKTFILNTPMAKQALSGAIKDDRLIANGYDPMVNMLEAYLPTDLLDPQRMKKGNLRPIIESYLTRVAQKAAALEAAVPKDGPIHDMVQATNWKNFDYAVESNSTDSATIIMKPANSPEKRIELVRYEDRWLPKQMVEEWDKNINDGISNLGKITPEQLEGARQAILNPRGPFGMVNGLVQNFLAAKDQQAFDQSLMSAMPIVAMAGAAMNSARTMQPQPPPAP